MPTVCPTIGCVDKKLDPANCGACAMACGATATCNAGACGPAPTVILPAIAGCTAMTIAVDPAAAVYYADGTHGTINKVGAAAPIATGETGATLLALNGTNLFWYAAGTKKIRMVAAAGGTPVDVYTDGDGRRWRRGSRREGDFLVTADGASIYVSLGNSVPQGSVAGGAAVAVCQRGQGQLPGVRSPAQRHDEHRLPDDAHRRRRRSAPQRDAGDLRHGRPERA